LWCSSQRSDCGGTGLFLDTTFLSPKYNFPPQEITLQAAAEIALKEDKPGTLIVIGTYQIGKEKVLLSVAKALGKKVYVNPDKYATYHPRLWKAHVGAMAGGSCCSG
jgi:DNA cross-link repair 1A protein